MAISSSPHGDGSRSRGAHAAARRRSLPGRTATLAGLTATAVVVAGGAAPFVLADTSPQKVLQAVEITLGTDGGIDALQATTVRTGDDGAQTETRRLDPSAHAGDLPVRISTSWVHDGRVGTDLADLEGVDGLVQVDVTVENLTVRPERFQYDAAGVARDVYELVATPLTVVASATLADAGLADVRQPAPGTTEPGTTNGVVSSTDGGDTTVQWAALLAPPRLSATTTFTLVQDADDFELPELSLTVQPGLATDTSVTRLLSQAFDGSGALVGGENNTIGLIASINATLAQATDSLAQVRETLAVSAGQVGAAATASLTSTASSLDASSAAVLADLQALNGSVAGTVGATNSSALTSLQGSVRSVLDYFGTPAPTDAKPTDGDCGAAPAAAAPASTLLGQLSQVSAQLTALSGASGKCVAALRSALNATIGDPETCAALPAAPLDEGTGKGKGKDKRAGQPLVCQLSGTSADLVDLAAQVQAASARILGTIDAKAVDTVGVRIGELVSDVRAAQAAARLLDPKGEASSLKALSDTLAQLSGSLETATTRVGASSTDGIRKELATLAAQAQTRIGQLQGSGTSVQAQLGLLASSLCAFSDSLKGQDKLAGVDLEQIEGATALAGDVVFSLGDLRKLVDGEGCVGKETGAFDGLFPGSLSARVADQVKDWEEVLKATDLTAGDPKGAAQAVLELDGQLSAARDAVAALRPQVDAALRLVDGSADGGGELKGKALRTAVSDLVAQLDALYDDTRQPAVCEADDGRATAPLNRLAASFVVVDCNQDNVAAQLTTLLDSTSSAVATAAEDDVAGLSGAVVDVRTGGEAALDVLARSLAGQLDTAAAAQQAQGAAVVAEQKARLDAVQAAAQRELDAAAQEAVGRLAEQVARSNSQQSAASAALQNQLQKVLTDLGSASQGRGLLGVIQNSAGQTGVRTAQVQDVSSAAASFRGVRLAELADAQLEQQQLSRSLQSAQLFPSFAEDLPAGSTSSTVFVARLGKES